MNIHDLTINDHTIDNKGGEQMGLTLTDLMALFPNQLWLELSEQEQEDTWQQVAQQRYSNSAARWNAYLNQLCLQRCLTWLQHQELEPEPLLQVTGDSSVWEVVNGTVLTLNQTRIVLLPDDKSNLDQFRVPQEWVDIPAWAADAYLAIQVNLEAGWLRVWGYVTGDQIRGSFAVAGGNRATYDRLDQTYCLEVEDLIPDLNVFWVTQAMEPSRHRATPCLPTLLPSQVQPSPLLEQLSHPTAYSPRLILPFEEWAATVSSDENRQQLYHLRLKQEVTLKPAANVELPSGESQAAI
jgi:hypothetical protein